MPIVNSFIGYKESSQKSIVSIYASGYQNRAATSTISIGGQTFTNITIGDTYTFNADIGSEYTISALNSASYSIDIYDANDNRLNKVTSVRNPSYTFTASGNIYFRVDFTNSISR